MKITIRPDDKMVEIPIGELKHYECRVEFGIMLKAHVLERNENEAGKLAEEVANELIKILKDRLVYDDYAPYGVEITNWAAETKDVEEVEDVCD